MTEKISTLIDAETQAGGKHVPVKQIADESSQNVWRHYYMIGDVLRGQHAGVTKKIIDGSLANAIRDRIEQEPTRIAPGMLAGNVSTGIQESNFARNFSKSASGLAIAASLAAIAFFGLNLQEQPIIPDAPDAPLVADNIPLQSPVFSGDTQWHTAQPDSENDLNAFLVEHGEFTSPSGLNGLIAYAKFVSYDTRR